MHHSAAAVVCVVMLWSRLAVIEGQTASNATLRFLSFNTFLAGPRIPEIASQTRYPERRTAFLDQLSDPSSPLNQADAVCLQEVQYEDDIKLVQRRANAAGFAYSYSFVDSLKVTPEALAGGLPPACSPLSMLQLAECLNEASGKCAAVRPLLYDIRALVSCVSLNCSDDVMMAELAPECVSCLINLGPEGLTNCSLPENTRRAHSPTYGLLLISKHPLYGASAKAFEVPVPSIYSRGYLQAELQSTNGAGNWKVICTHLYPLVNGALYSGPYGSAAEENFNNTNVVLKAVAGADNAVIMGDMNHGPSVVETEVEGIFTDNYKAVLKDNFCSPYANDTTPPQCTFCATNPINYAVSSTEMTIVDHIYLRHRGNQCPPAISKRVLTSNVIPILLGLIPISDHYGIEVAITVPATVVNDSPSGAGRVVVSVLAAVVSLLFGFTF